MKLSTIIILALLCIHVAAVKFDKAHTNFIVQNLDTALALDTKYQSDIKSARDLPVPILEAKNLKRIVESKKKKQIKIKVVATAYYRPSPDQKDFITGSYEEEVKLNGGGETTSGAPLEIGTIAVDPKVFPEGTELNVPDYGVGTAKDTGGKIKGRRIDVYMGEGDEGRELAAAWGRKEIIVTIL